MEKRVKIHKKELESVYGDLKSEGHTLRNINSKIDADFRNYLYKGHSLDPETFAKLRSLYKDKINYKEIQHVNGKGNPDKLEKLRKCPEAAELFGIILGDGHLTKNSQHCLCITLHEEEQELIDHIQYLCKQLIGKKAKEYQLKDSRALQLKIYSKELVNKLTDFGLKTGDKVENQVSVPDWINDKEEYQRKCLRGLVDTDGCIYTQSRDDRTIIRFKNRSQPLLKDFKEMCRNLGIKPSDGGGQYSVQVASRPDVCKFISEIKPIKAKKTDENFASNS